jgi:Domain of unknown function (DUF3943)
VSAATIRIAAVVALLVLLPVASAFAEEPNYVLLPDKSLGSLDAFGTLEPVEPVESAGALDFLSPLYPTPTTESVRWGRDWLGLGRDTALIFSYQVVTIGVFYVLPESVSNWSAEAKGNIWSRWWHNVQSPHWDTDSFGINYIGHPYFGSAYYTRARERGFGEFDSFVYAALASAMYEFGVESLFERPSYQDLFVTPIGGALLGLALEPIRTWIKLKPEPKWYDQLFLAATDPIGMLNGMFERLVGIKSDLRVDLGQGNRVYVQLRMNWN